MPSPRAAILQVPGSLVLCPSPGNAVLRVVLVGNLCVARSPQFPCWQRSSQRQEATARLSLRNGNTSCPGDGPCHPRLESTPAGVAPGSVSAAPRERSAAGKVLSGAGKEPLVGLSKAVPRQGAARGGKELLSGSTCNTERCWRGSASRWREVAPVLCRRVDFNLILDVVCPPAV